MLYSSFELGESFTSTAVYHWVDAAVPEDVPLLTLEDQGYETVYTRTELDGSVYTLALTGNPFDEEADTLWLLCFDGPGRTAAKYRITDSGFAYASMAAAMEVSGVLSRQDALNEFGMMVSGFRLEEERYLFYENFGRLRLILDLETGRTLFAGDDLYAMSLGSGRPAFYLLDFFEPEGDELHTPGIYVLRKGEVTRLPFAPTEDRAMIRHVSHAADGTWLIRVTDGNEESDAWLLWQEP